MRRRIVRRGWQLCKAAHAGSGAEPRTRDGAVALGHAEQRCSLLPRSLDGLYGMVYGLLAACRDAPTMQRALAIVEQLPKLGASSGLPLREGQTLAMELLLQRALEGGLESAVLDSPAYQRYSERRRAEGLGG